MTKKRHQNRGKRGKEERREKKKKKKKISSTRLQSKKEKLIKKETKIKDGKNKKISDGEIKKITKVQIKKSFKNRRKKIIKTSYLVFLLVFSILTVIVINLRHYFPPLKNPIRKNIPATLRQITAEKDFLDIQNNLIKQKTTSPTDNLSVCPDKNLLNSSEQRSIIIDKKYLAVLKRGKIFIVNLATNKYITKTEVSPIPKKETEAIQYNNIYATENTLIVTGYRHDQKSLEISLFELSPGGNLIRKSSYDLPGNECVYGGKVIGDKFISYTSRDLQKINYASIPEIDIWNEQQKVFDNKHINNSQIFYNNLKLKSPYLHTITTCQIRNSVLRACRQQHFIDNKINSLTINSNHLYAWTSQQNNNQKTKRVIPNSLIYQISLGNKNSPKIIQADGVPIDNSAIEINNNTLKTVVYQNDSNSPAWLTTFSNNKLSFLSINLKNFQDKGFILNNPDDYQPLPSNFSYSLKNKFIIYGDSLLEINPNDSKIKTHQNNKSSDMDISGKILFSDNLPEKNKVLLIYTKENNLYANWLNYSNDINLGQEMILANNIDEQAIKIIDTEINDFKIDDKQFISLPVVNQVKNDGQLYLLTINSDTLAKAYTLNINKNFQRLNDGCQNSCQEGWTKVLMFFPEENLNRIYSLTGSYLKSFKFTTQDKLQLLRTINYTTKPAPPKPRRPKARVPVGAKIVNGKYVCKKKHDYVGKSKKNNKGYLHLDLECCLDPDEYPNPWCTYRPGELNVTKLRYKDYHGNTKKKKHHH